MTNRYADYGHYLEQLQDQLDQYRRQRGWLVICWLLWLLLLLFVGLPQLALGFEVLPSLLILTPLIPLIYYTFQHQQFGSALEKEVLRLPYRELSGEFGSVPTKRKHSDEVEPRYAVGDDGELIAPDGIDDLFDTRDSRVDVQG